MKKERLDIALTEKGLAESRSLAQRIIMSGEVMVNQQIIDKPSIRISMEDEISIIKKKRFVSRGGEKLEAALMKFGLERLEGKICADVGSSTGGFTDCLLLHRAEKVYAIDVGYGLLHWRLRNDPRVVIMERTNARYVIELPEKVDLVTIDASFISLKTILPVVQKWFSETGEIVALIKPQFEAGRTIAAHGRGVIRDVLVQKKIVEEIIIFSLNNGYGVKDIINSPLLGPKGNREFLINLFFPRTGQEKPESLKKKIIEKIENEGVFLAVKQKI